MTLYLYTLIIRLYHFVIRVSAPFSPKARLWIYGRKDQWDHLSGIDLADPIWIHCSSLGEFEQGRPLIESIKKLNPDQSILLTFFSPSGYTIRKDYPIVDKVMYLPVDTPSNANRFIQLVNPSLAVFVKYDFWFNSMSELRKRQIPFIYISLILAPKHFLFKNFARPLLEILSFAQQLFVQDVRTGRLLQDRGLNQITVAGDTRIDRVLSMSLEKNTYPSIASLSKNRFTIVFGSVWPQDLKVIAPYINKRLKDDYLFILASHEIGHDHLDALDGHFRVNPERLSLGNFPASTKILSIDTMGDLAHIYQYSDLAYIGGGFGTGIHSILEPAATPVPIIFGPNHQKFREAVDLIRVGGAKSVTTSSEFEAVATFYQEETNSRMAKEEIRRYMETNRGATSQILQYLVDHKLT